MIIGGNIEVLAPLQCFGRVRRIRRSVKRLHEVLQCKVLRVVLQCTAVDITVLTEVKNNISQTQSI